MTGLIPYFIAGLMAFPVVPPGDVMCKNLPLMAGARVTSICPSGPVDILKTLYNKNYKTSIRLRAKERNYDILCSNHKSGDRIRGVIYAFYTGAEPYPVTLIGTTPEVADMADKFNDKKNIVRVHTLLGTQVLRRNIPSATIYHAGKYYKFLWIKGKIFEYSEITPVTGKNMTNAYTCAVKTGRVGL